MGSRHAFQPPRSTGRSFWADAPREKFTEQCARLFAELVDEEPAPVKTKAAGKSGPSHTPSKGAKK